MLDRGLSTVQEHIASLQPPEFGTTPVQTEKAMLIRNRAEFVKKGCSDVLDNHTFIADICRFISVLSGRKRYQRPLTAPDSIISSMT